MGLSETPLYIEKLFEREDSVLSVRLAGVGKVEVLEGGRAIVKAIFSDIFILADYNATYVFLVAVLRHCSQSCEVWVFDSNKDVKLGGAKGES